MLDTPSASAQIASTVSGIIVFSVRHTQPGGLGRPGDANSATGSFSAMIEFPVGNRISLAADVSGMRSSMNALAAKELTALAEDPFNGHAFLFRGLRDNMIKLQWWSGDGLCLLVKRLERRRFVWR